ncbi:hypothetical protein [Pedobacter cryoconitis]|uniref:HMA domain-containing protein n=1 Tax=Pedobacter cryoconitis TaxID=188932 RepID=A0A7X0J3Y1_9SPHI|nr:hypothetical protein [Pedobacter cryoconitis]MBB6499347.1 hypothetical protein [Pedobacter cryoconitis]
MRVFIFVSNINTEADIHKLKRQFDQRRDIADWSVDLSDEEKVLRVVTGTLERPEVIALVRSCGYDCHKMDW